MNISIELEDTDWVTLCTMLEAATKKAVENIGNDPLLYSKVSRIVNSIESQVTQKVAQSIDGIKGPGK